MNSFNSRFCSHILCLFCLASHQSFAQKNTYTASLALAPVSAESKDKGQLVDFIRVWEKMTDSTINIKVYPFKRSLRNAINQQVSFHIPLIKNPAIGEDNLNFDYSTSAIFNVNFVLYTNKAKQFNKKNISKYNILTSAAHVDLFDFKIGKHYSSVESTLRMLNKGMIDGYIYAEADVDPVLKKLGFKNIKRQLYAIYNVHAVLPKGEKGNDADQMITEAINKITADGRWDSLMKPIYVNWQP